MILLSNKMSFREAEVPAFGRSVVVPVFGRWAQGTAGGCNRTAGAICPLPISVFYRLFSRRFQLRRLIRFLIRSRLRFRCLPGTCFRGSFGDIFLSYQCNFILPYNIF